MTRFAIAAAVIAAGGLFLWGQVSKGKTHLKPGDMAPNFSLPATTGATFTLADYRGKKNVVLAFVPKAFTGG